MHRSKTVSLFDDFVGKGEQRRGHSEAKRLRGLEVERQFELGQLLDWQIAWLGAPEDTTDVESGMTISFRHTIAVAHKAARGDKLAVWIDSSYRVVGRDADDLLAPDDKNGSLPTTTAPICC